VLLSMGAVLQPEVALVKKVRVLRPAMKAAA
jgi:hypothetical protein